MGIYDFKQWATLRKEEFDSPTDPTDKFRFNSDHDTGDDYEKSQRELIKVVMSKYQERFIRFLKEISDENRDNELKELIKKIETDRSPSGWKPDMAADKDEVVPAMADRGIDPNQAE